MMREKCEFECGRESGGVGAMKKKPAVLHAAKLPINDP
jgi:hypothetical protein